MTISQLLLVLLCIVVYYIYSLLTPPRSFPKNIPTIPFYVSLLPLFTKLGQDEIYDIYLKQSLLEYGAVKLYFGSRWNILVHRSTFIHEIFKDEEGYAKSGNQEKIPYSVLAGYTGENIISAHGEKWREYKAVIQPALQRNFDNENVRHNARKLTALLLEGCRDGKAVVALQDVQRFSMENVGKELLGVDFGTLDKKDVLVHSLQMSVKREIFKPIFLNFPILDLLPIPSRKRARQLSTKFADMLCDKVKESKCSENTVGYRILDALDTGRWTRLQARHNMTIVFVAGHENPQLSLISMIYLLAKHQDVQLRLRAELQSIVGEATSSSLATLPFFHSFMLECLRLFPPISQIINRRSSRPILLGGTIHIPANTYIGYNGYGTHRDRSIWGEDADEFKPDRWGETVGGVIKEYRRRKSRGEYITFHGGRRACLGEQYAMMHNKAALYEMLIGMRWVLDESWEERMTPAGPLFPFMLKVKFSELYGGSREIV